jgi:hypothetical protein
MDKALVYGTRDSGFRSPAESYYFEIHFLNFLNLPQAHNCFKSEMFGTLIIRALSGPSRSGVQSINSIMLALRFFLSVL